MDYQSSENDIKKIPSINQTVGRRSTITLRYSHQNKSKLQEEAFIAEKKKFGGLTEKLKKMGVRI